MNVNGNFWHFLFVEPEIWLLRCFFQPAGFQRDVERETLGKRFSLMLRLLLPLFCSIYPFAMLLRILLYLCFPSTYSTYTLHSFFILQPDLGLFIFDCFWATAVSCLLGGLFGSLFSVVYGVVLALALGLANGIIVNNQNDLFVGVIFGLSFGCFLGLTFNSLGAVRRSGLLKTTLGTIIGLLVGIGTGLFTGLFGGYFPGLFIGLLGGPSLQQSASIVGSVAGILIGGMAGPLLVRIIGSIVHSNMDNYLEVIEASTRIGIAVAAAFGVAIGTPVGDVGMHQGSLLDALSVGWMVIPIVGTAFLCTYITGYYRLLLYPLSALSVIKIYLACQKDPHHVFYYLHHSALFCDECVFLPLPYVRQLLLIAAELDIDHTLVEIDFLLQERPQQRNAVLAAVIEIALNDLRSFDSLRDISQAHLRLQVTLPPEVRLFNQQVVRLFRYLEDASRDAASYYSRTNRKARYESLENMLSALQKISVRSVFHEPYLNRRFEELVQSWLLATTRELANVSQDTEDFGYIANPYAPGLVLELRDPLFVGRQDLAQQLSEALLRPHRPTFFLSGERRMGKSSILNQLPDLLGSQYLPVFYDLQMTGIASSAAALLAALAEGIYDALAARGMLLKTLEYDQLREDQRQNEAVVYHRFGRWLKEVELLLEREERVLLLAFDEFEKLEEASSKGYLDLALLLDWLRSTMQNRPRIALLFSGVKSVGEMGASWSGYFVNVEALNVSFLRPLEAKWLITHPAANFPGDDIFNAQVVDAIIQVTGCHPFLIQALCSIIVTQLNMVVRDRAEVADIPNSIDELFRKWEDNYFQDLWERTDVEQRLCLVHLLSLDIASHSIIQAHSGLTESTVRRALQHLHKRDLITLQQGNYSIASPIFKLWVQRSI